MRRETALVLLAILLTAGLFVVLLVSSRRMADFYFSMMSD